MGVNYSDSMVFKRGGKGVRVCINMNCLLSSEIRNENITIDQSLLVRESNMARILRYSAGFIKNGVSGAIS